jgi:DNA-directed RNA polymerase subunit omega
MSKRKVEKTAPRIVEEVETKPPDQAWFIPSDEERSIYRFIIAGAKRARQLQGGARPLISTTSRKPTKIAMEEVRRGEIAVEIQPDPEKLAVKKPEE